MARKGDPASLNTMNQLLLGASVPFIIAAVFYLLRRCRASVVMLVIVPITMVASAIWAVLPDLPRLLGYQQLYARLVLDPACDIFWWHYTIDQHEVDSPWFAVGFIGLLVMMLVVILRELRIAEHADVAMGGLQGRVDP